jgi:hypothetical protein
MKKLLALLLSTLIIMSCQQKSSEEQTTTHDATAPDVVETSENQQLYNEVMKIHDEVMPETETIYTIKKELKKKITDNPTMDEAERIKIDALVAKLDSADKSMMDWMHEFQPIPDSLGEEKAREYLENEMERIKKVQSNIQNAIREAKGN